MGEDAAVWVVTCPGCGKCGRATWHQAGMDPQRGAWLVLHGVVVEEGDGPVRRSQCWVDALLGRDLQPIQPPHRGMPRLHK